MLVSTITAKAQTTLPSGVRKALGVGPGDKLAYVVQGDHAVIRKASTSEDESDPALDGFLALLESDIATHPRRLRPISAGLLERVRALTAGVRVDLDERIEGPVAL